MKRGQAIEAIVALVDELRTPGRARWATRGRHEQAQNLLDLARELQGILVPVTPNTEFRRRLHGDLVLRAQNRVSISEAEVAQQRKTGILLGAAAIGSVASVVGLVIAYVLHNKNGRATTVARG